MPGGSHLSPAYEVVVPIAESWATTESFIVRFDAQEYFTSPEVDGLVHTLLLRRLLSTSANCMDVLETGWTEEHGKGVGPINQAKCTALPR